MSEVIFEKNLKAMEKWYPEFVDAIRNGEYEKDELIIETMRQSLNDIYIKEVFIRNKRKKGYVFSHQDLINAERIRFILMN